MLTGSGFREESFVGFDGARRNGVVLRIAPARQALYFALMAGLAVASILVALSPIGAHAFAGLGPWVLGGLGVLGIVYLLAGGRRWIERPIVAFDDTGLVIRAFGGATSVPWAAVSEVNLDMSGRRPQLRLQLRSGAGVQRHGTASLDGLTGPRYQRVPATMFAVRQEDLASRLRETRSARDIR